VRATDHFDALTRDESHRAAPRSSPPHNLLNVTTNGGLSITLVRHGESTWNELGLIQGHDNTAQLTARGRDQARWAGESLRGLGFQALISSDLDRARETANIIGSVLGLDATTDPLLRERGFGLLEGRPLSELTPAITGIEQRVMVNPDASAPDGETFRDVVARAQLFVKRLLDERPQQRVLVVSHGGTIRAMRASVTGDPIEGSAWYTVGNCSVWPLDVRNTDRH
jgi:broad specificity phosphatase PhoE